jgi:hypothetical protein
MRSSQICQLHIASGDALHDSIGGIEAENARLKDRVKELEEALIPMPLLANPLAIAMPATPAANLKGSSSLLASCRGYVENNIKKRMELVTEAWETSQTITSLGTRAHSLLEHLQAELKDEEHFYLNTGPSFWHHCQQHDRNKKKTTRSSIQKLDRSIKCMLERKSEEPASHCSVM